MRGCQYVFSLRVYQERLYLKQTRTSSIHWFFLQEDSIFFSVRGDQFKSLYSAIWILMEITLLDLSWTDDGGNLSWVGLVSALRSC